VGCADLLVLVFHVYSDAAETFAFYCLVVLSCEDFVDELAIMDWRSHGGAFCIAVID